MHPLCGASRRDLHMWSMWKYDAGVCLSHIVSSKVRPHASSPEFRTCLYQTGAKPRDTRTRGLRCDAGDPHSLLRAGMNRDWVPLLRCSPLLLRSVRMFQDDRGHVLSIPGASVVETGSCYSDAPPFCSGVSACPKPRLPSWERPPGLKNDPYSCGPACLSPACRNES